MTYKYREVKCPQCEHIFMWSNTTRESYVVYEYRIKETGAYVEKAKCPKCAADMLVLEHVLEGIDLKDDRIETIGVRGI